MKLRDRFWRSLPVQRGMILTCILEMCAFPPGPVSCVTVALTILYSLCMPNLSCLYPPLINVILNSSSFPTAWCLLVDLSLQLFLVIFPARLERSRQGMLLGDVGHRPLR